MQLIDLSVSIVENNRPEQETTIRRMSHRDGARHFSKEKAFFADGGGEHSSDALAAVYENIFPDQEFLSYEFVSTSTHTGTHLDAPFHYGSKCEGRPSRTIDEVPLDWCCGPGLVLDLRHTTGKRQITREDLLAAVDRLNYRVDEGTIVLLHTGCDRFVGKAEYYTCHSGVTVDAISWLVECGVRTIGIDAFSFDPPFAEMTSAYRRNGNASQLWPAHMLGRHREYLQLEGLGNLAALPKPHGFFVCCFPIKIFKAGAGWVRAVAMFNNSNLTESE